MPVLSALVERPDPPPPLYGLCAGFEVTEWRAEALAESMMDSLIDFVLPYADKAGVNSVTARRMLRRAATMFYTTDCFQNRGEFGELLLHMVLREFFNSEPAVAKLFFKDSMNDTVKGFDSVHVVEADDGLELWLGEVKFYNNLTRAIRDVVAELVLHSKRDYLHAEFLAINNKIDDDWEHAAKLRELLDEHTSLDDVFKRLRVPVLLTYDSKTVTAHRSYSDEYLEEFEREVVRGHTDFSGRALPENLTVLLILVPLKSKDELVAILDRKLKALQA